MCARAVIIVVRLRKGRIVMTRPRCTIDTGVRMVAGALREGEDDCRGEHTLALCDVTQVADVWTTTRPGLGVVGYFGCTVTGGL